MKTSYDDDEEEQGIPVRGQKVRRRKLDKGDPTMW